MYSPLPEGLACDVCIAATKNAARLPLPSTHADSLHQCTRVTKHHSKQLVFSQYCCDSDVVVIAWMVHIIRLEDGMDHTHAPLFKHSTV